ncbi:hypothetical protein [Paraprevotella clara]
MINLIEPSQNVNMTVSLFFKKDNEDGLTISTFSMSDKECLLTLENRP